MSLQAEEQALKRRVMQEVPQEPITADPREDEEDDEDVPEEEDEERGGQAHESNSEECRREARAGRRREVGRSSPRPGSHQEGPWL
jgi:hypothetical protein